MFVLLENENYSRKEEKGRETSSVHWFTSQMTVMTTVRLVWSWKPGFPWCRDQRAWASLCYFPRPLAWSCIGSGTSGGGPMKCQCYRWRISLMNPCTGPSIVLFLLHSAALTWGDKGFILIPTFMVMAAENWMVGAEPWWSNAFTNLRCIWLMVTFHGLTKIMWPCPTGKRKELRMDLPCAWNRREPTVCKHT